MKTRVIAGAAATAVGLTIVGGAVANAAPLDPPAPSAGTSNPNLDPSTPSTPAPAVPAPAPAVEPAPAPAPEPEAKSYWVAPPVEYNNVPTRPVPTYEYNEPVAPVQIQELHLPVAVEAVAPIEAPKERLRIGDFVTDQPNWLSDEYLDRTNNTSAVIEAQVNTFWKSIGVDAERSDRIAAATIGGGVTGAVTGALAAGVPAATVGGLVGGTIGGVQGAAIGGALPVVGLPAGITTGVAGTAAGAAIGAAAAGIPAAFVGGVVGGVSGAALGTAFGAGDSTGAPREFVLPNAVEPDVEAITTDAAAGLAQLETQQPGIASAVVDTVTAAPQFADQVTSQAVAAREATLAQPGGEQVIAGLDAAAVELNYAFGPAAGLVNQALAAAQAGLA